MKSETINAYIWFGLHWRYVQDSDAGLPVHGRGQMLFNIDAVLDGLSKFGLIVTSRAAFELRMIRAELAETAQDTRLSEDQAKRLREIMAILQRTMDAEGAGLIAYTVTEKRLDVRKLLSAPHELFAPDVFALLPDVARFDFKEAGLCIAFERSTAAAFHLLRGTEDVLRMFYCGIVKRKRVDPLMWGSMTQSLKQRRSPPPAEILQNLDNVRQSFRNPTQHPEKIYDLHEAQDLFALCVDLVNRMMRTQMGI